MFSLVMYCVCDRETERERCMDSHEQREREREKQNIEEQSRRWMDENRMHRASLGVTEAEHRRAERGIGACKKEMKTFVCV